MSRFARRLRLRSTAPTSATSPTPEPASSGRWKCRRVRRGMTLTGIFAVDHGRREGQGTPGRSRISQRPHRRISRPAAISGATEDRTGGPRAPQGDRHRHDRSSRSTCRSGTTPSSTSNYQITSAYQERSIDPDNFYSLVLKIGRPGQHGEILERGGRCLDRQGRCQRGRWRSGRKSTARSARS